MQSNAEGEFLCPDNIYRNDPAGQEEVCIPTGF